MSKTNPNHKCRLSYGVSVSCSCGWSSQATAFGKGARNEALTMWHMHRERCEAVDGNKEKR